MVASLMLAAGGWAGAAETGPPDPGERLIKAARANDVETVTRLLAQGADPNAHDGATVLIAAAGSRARGPERLVIRQRLLVAGARVNGPASDGLTALSIAAVLLDPVAVHLLLQHGADPNLVDLHCVTPLLHSLLPHGDEAKHLDVVRLLIGSGAHVNGRAMRDGRTALGSAVRRGSAAMVALLLAGGADPNLADDAGTTPLMAAAPLSSSQVGAARS